MSKASHRWLAATLLVVACAASVAKASELRPHHRRHHAVQAVDAEPVVVPPGYAYGGYGDGPGPGWTDGRTGRPGYGYIPPGYPDAGFDLGR